MPSVAKTTKTPELKLEGTTLKSWKIGKYIGSGACAQVYEVEDTLPLIRADQNKQYVIKIAELPIKKQRGYKNKMRLADCLHWESTMYNRIRQYEGVPHIPSRAYGEDKGYRFLVIEKLGLTFADVLKTQGLFLERKAASIGIEIIKTLKNLHSQNILYTDIKPENFMFSCDQKKVYIVDFGITGSYSKMGKHISETKVPIQGTPNFLSVKCHQGTIGSRRDDIEGLIYVLIYLIKGSLPWEHAKNDTEGAEIKANASIESLVQGISSIWGEILVHARNCDFKEQPNYQYYVDQLKRI